MMCDHEDLYRAAAEYNRGIRKAVQETYAELDPDEQEEFKRTADPDIVAMLDQDGFTVRLPWPYGE